MVVFRGDRRDLILQAVRGMYSELARHPDGAFHFPTGRAACELVGYPPEQLDAVPPGAVESFAGVGWPFAAGAIRRGDVALDIGSGSGTDALIAARLVGRGGRVLALDLTDAMRRKLRANAHAAGVANLHVVEGDAEAIPLADASVDAVTSNGVLNLVPDKRAAVEEIRRVLRPGGRVQVADVVLGTPPTPECRADPELWAECVVGATTEADWLALFREAGFEDVAVLSRFDYFAHSPAAETRAVAASLGAIAITARARKPAGARASGTDRGPARAASEAARVRDWAAGTPAPYRVGPGIPGKTDRFLDLGAMGCGEGTAVVRRELREVEPGRVLGVRSELPEAGEELPAWCRLTGHEYLGGEPDGEARIHFIRRKRA